MCSNGLTRLDTYRQDEAMEFIGGFITALKWMVPAAGLVLVLCTSQTAYALQVHFPG